MNRTMKCIIVEDEQPAAERLKKLVEQCDPSITVAATTDSVAATLQYFANNAHPDFMLMDIQLGDGISFEILEQIEISCPIIFTTAYNEYAIKAFKVNSIDYLLKPIDKDELFEAIAKLKRQLGERLVPEAITPTHLAEAMRMLTGRYKERFVTRIGEKLVMLPVENIAAFVSMEKSTYAYTKEGKMVSLDYTLDSIENLIDPLKFFRVSRKHIVAVDSISEVSIFSTSRLKLKIKGTKDDDIIVSRERYAKFKEWLDR